MIKCFSRSEIHIFSDSHIFETKNSIIGFLIFHVAFPQRQKRRSNLHVIGFHKYKHLHTIFIHTNLFNNAILCRNISLIQ